MNREQLFTYLLFYTWLVGSAVCLLPLYRNRGYWLAVICLSVSAALPFLAGHIFPGDNVLLVWLSRFSRGHLPVAAAAGAAVLPWILWYSTAGKQQQTSGNAETPSSTFRLGLAFLACFLITVVCFSVLMLKAPPVDETDPGHAVHMVEPAFALEQVADLKQQATRITVSQAGKIFIASTVYTDGTGLEYGTIFEVVPRETGEGEVRDVATSSLLWRVYGLTTQGNDLFLARSGRFSKAHQGRITFEKNGCITKLSDLDGDGEYEYYDDVVSGLPGSQGPIDQHQTNGLLFRADGSLLVLSGNHGNRQLPQDDWEGCVLEISSDFQTIAPLASGLRNPFSMTFGPEGELFLVDQDWGTEGDELNHITRDGHYGHPFVVGKQTGAGFTAPLYLGAPESNLVAVAYSRLPGLEDCLLVTDMFQQKIVAVQIARQAETFVVRSVRDFAFVPNPVDLCVGPDQSIYVLARTGQVFRIRALPDR